MWQCDSGENRAAGQRVRFLESAKTGAGGGVLGAWSE